MGERAQLREVRLSNMSVRVGDPVRVAVAGSRWKVASKPLSPRLCMCGSVAVFLRGCIKTSNGTFDGSAKIPRCHDRLSNSTDRVDAHLTQKFSSSAMWLVRSLRFTIMDWPSCAHAARNIGTKSGGN